MIIPKPNEKGKGNDDDRETWCNQKTRQSHRWHIACSPMYMYAHKMQMNSTNGNVNLLLRLILNGIRNLIMPTRPLRNLLLN